MYRHLRKILFKMKLPKLFILCTVFGFLLLQTSCDNTAQKVVKAEENVVEAEKDLQSAEADYLADVEQYRILSAEKIAANDKSIAEFNARIEREKKDVRAEYKAKIKELEQKNSDMKKKMDDYKVEGKDQWEIFKTEFSRDMDELGTALSNITVKNK